MELCADVVLAGKLRLVRPLGRGGMGTVWVAVHLALDTEVAVKLIHPERMAANPSLLLRFEREARAAAKIRSPHVVEIKDYGTLDEGIPYLVMEHLHGCSLAELLERRPRLEPASVVRLVRQVAVALEAAHALGVVHRDVKPHNVFVTEERDGEPVTVKVLDFGVAKLMDEGPLGELHSGLTETGVVIGSPPYMSPEQLEGRRDVDLRTDLWGLGVLVYQLLTGALPFEGGSVIAVGAAVLAGRYQPATARRSALPPAIDHWLAKALCLEPAGRFESAGEMARTLAEVLAGAGAEVPESHRAPGDDPAHAATEPATPVDTRKPDAVSAAAATDRHEAPAADPRDHEAPAADPRDHEALALRPAPADLPTVQSRRLPGARPAAASPGDGSLAAPAQPARRGLRVALAAGLLAAAGAGVGIAAWRVGATSSPSPPEPTTLALAPGECPAGMVFLAGGSFEMGSPEGPETPTDETPPHAVTVAPFCLDTTEVTVAAYAACAGCAKPPRTVEFEGLTPKGRQLWSRFCNGADRPEHPMNCVDWPQARAYCESLGRRLPSEQEWELAARGGGTRTYPWGEGAPSGALLNACGPECTAMSSRLFRELGRDESWPSLYADDDGAEATSPVGRYAVGASPDGVLDMAGNVWEWTESAYCPYGHDDCGDSRRVLRGGAWDSLDPNDLRAARRYPTAPTARGRSIGLRCALGAQR